MTVREAILSDAELAQAEMDTRLAALYAEAEAMSDFSAASLRGMALLAYKNRHDPAAMKLLSGLWGRNSRSLGRAVQRFPRWFMKVDNQEIEPAEPDELLAIFSIASLPKEAGERLYRTFREFSLRAWQVRERVELERQEGRRQNASVRLNIKKARVLLATERPDHNSITLTWKGEPLFTPSDWEDLEVEVHLLRGVQEQPLAGPDAEEA